MQLNNLLQYKPGKHLISKDLELVDKNAVKNSSLWAKLGYWWKGTFDAKKTAAKIDECVRNYANSQDFTKLSTQELQTRRASLAQLHENLKALHGRFSQKGVNALSHTMTTMQNTLDAINAIYSFKVRKQEKSRRPKQTSQESGKLKSKRSIKTKASPSLDFPKIQSTAVPSSNKPSALELAFISVQNQINRLDPQDPLFKQRVGEIREMLQRMTNDHPTLKKQLLPLITMMKILETNGHLAFKPSFLQTQLLERCQLPSEYDKKTLLIPIYQILNFLKNSSLNSANVVQVELIKKASEVKGKWQELSEKLFEERLQLLQKRLNLNPQKFVQVKKNILNIALILKNLRSELANRYKNGLDFFNEKYSSEEFKQLMSHYLHDQLELNQEDILDGYIQRATKDIFKNVDLEANMPSEHWQKAGEALFKERFAALSEFMKASLEKYTWFHENLANIKVAYDQAADHHRNQGDGTCMVNSLRRHTLLSRQPNVSIQNADMGSDEQARIKQARINLENHLKSPDLQHFEKMLKEHGFNPETWITRDEQLTDHSPEDYAKLVDAVTQKLPNGQPLLGILNLVYHDGQSSVVHTINLQVNPKARKFRIVDDNIGAIEFSSLQEMKKQLAAYLRIFYPEYQRFRFINP